jgi:hypothetical protein
MVQQLGQGSWNWLVPSASWLQHRNCRRIAHVQKRQPLNELTSRLALLNDLTGLLNE